MAKGKYWQTGNNLDWVNTTNELVEAGEIVSLNTRIGIAGTDIPPGETGSVAVSGVFALPKAAALLITLGSAVYYNSTNDNIDATNTGVPAGYAVSSANASDTEVYVKLLG